jgi:hypothetical protein
MNETVLGLITLLGLASVGTVVVTLAWRRPSFRDRVARSEAKRRAREGSLGSPGV